MPGTGRKPPLGPGPGRPSKISEPQTKKKIARLLKALRESHFLEVACKLAGLPVATVYSWIERGGQEETGVFRAFLEALDDAEAMGEESPLKTLRRAASNGDVKAAQFLLERRHYRRWGRRSFTVEEERGPVAASGSVVPYEVRIPVPDRLEPEGAGHAVHGAYNQARGDHEREDE